MISKLKIAASNVAIYSLIKITFLLILAVASPSSRFIAIPAVLIDMFCLRIDIKEKDRLKDDLMPL